MGQRGAGLEALAEAQAILATNGGYWCEAELHWLRGELLLAQGDAWRYQAEASLCQALAVARRQQAKAIELRASISLGRLWERQGQSTAARRLLADLYDWFTEGFDTGDLRDTRAWLAALSRS